MTKKQILHSVLFAGILAVVLCLLSDLFEFRDIQLESRYKNYRSLKKNTVDAVIVGTSGMDRYWNGPKAYEEYGITMYPLSSDQQPSWLIKNVLEEAKRSQDLKLVVIDMRPFTVAYPADTDKYETSSRRVIDNLPFFSLNRLDAVKTTVEVLKSAQPEMEHDVLSYYLPFTKYHTRWQADDFLIDEDDEKFSPYLGFFVRKTVSARGMDYFERTIPTEEKRALDPSSETALYELLEYLSKQEYEVLFLDTPHYLTEDEYAKMNTILSILDEYGYDYKVYDAEDGTYNLYAEFYNDGHVNYYGAERFTEDFAQYLKENYDLPDRREDSDCAQEWSGAYDAIKQMMDTLETYKKMQKPVISVEKTDTGSVQISWDEVNTAIGYDVFRNTSEGGRYEIIARVEGKTTAGFTDTTVEAGKTYYYMIRAYKKVSGNEVYSNYSNTVSAAL